MSIWKRLRRLFFAEPNRTPPWEGPTLDQWRAQFGKPRAVSQTFRVPGGATNAFFTVRSGGGGGSGGGGLGDATPGPEIVRYYPGGFGGHRHYSPPAPITPRFLYQVDPEYSPFGPHPQRRRKLDTIADFVPAGDPKL